MLLLNPFLPRSCRELLSLLPGPLFRWQFSTFHLGSHGFPGREEDLRSFLEETERSRARRYPGFPLAYLAALTEEPLPSAPGPYTLWHLGAVEVRLYPDARWSELSYGSYRVNGAAIGRFPDEPTRLGQHVMGAFARRKELENKCNRLVQAHPLLVGLANRVLSEPDPLRAERLLRLGLRRLPPEALVRLL